MSWVNLARFCFSTSISLCECHMVPFLMHKRTFRAGSAILGVVYQALAYVSQLVCLAGFARKGVDAYSGRHSSELYGLLLAALSDLKSVPGIRDRRCIHKSVP